jgi:acetoin utilization deacetylase AcuC-like enzyme
VEELGVSAMTYQKEKIMALDESLHQITLEVLEGGYTSLGFASYKTLTLILTANGEQESLVDVIFSYYHFQTDQESAKLSNTMDSTLHFIQCVESYFLNGAS